MYLTHQANQIVVPKFDSKSKKFRSIFISDLHLGTPGCKIDYLVNFIKSHECEYLYLVGDIIDGWQLKKKFFWNQSHNDFIQKVLGKARKGTKVTYVIGNHDEVLRKLDNLEFGNISLVKEAVHTTLKRKKIWVIHGDQFDGVIKYAKWIAIFGDLLYSFLIKINNWFNAIRRTFGLSYWSISQLIKGKVKTAVSFIDDFEKTVTKEAKKRGFQGVLCGHIHKAEIKKIDGIDYFNDGDWVESLSAIVEDYEGNMKIVSFESQLNTKQELVEEF